MCGHPDRIPVLWTHNALNILIKKAIKSTESVGNQPRLGKQVFTDYYS
jgi:hypothetical protein